MDALQEEKLKKPDASDVDTPRGESAKAELIRLRGLIRDMKTQAT